MFYGKQVALWLSQSALNTFSEERLKIIDSLFGDPVKKMTVVGGRLWYAADCKAYGSIAYELLGQLSMLHEDKAEFYELVALEPRETGWTRQVFTNRRKDGERLLDIQPVFTFGGFPITKGQRQ